MQAPDSSAGFKEMAGALNSWLYDLVAEGVRLDTLELENVHVLGYELSNSKMRFRRSSGSRGYSCADLFIDLPGFGIKGF